jgi:hypothetical protein
MLVRITFDPKDGSSIFTIHLYWTLQERCFPLSPVWEPQHQQRTMKSKVSHLAVVVAWLEYSGYLKVLALVLGRYKRCCVLFCINGTQNNSLVMYCILGGEYCLHFIVLWRWSQDIPLNTGSIYQAKRHHSPDDKSQHSLLWEPRN